MKNERGQTATEYMAIISVVVIAVAAAAYVFVPTFNTGVGELSGDVSQILKDNGSTRGGFGLAANNASSGGYDTKASAGGGAVNHALTPAGSANCTADCPANSTPGDAAANGGF